MSEVNRLTTLYRAALDDLSRVFDRIDEIARAQHITLYGVGPEGLQMKGFCCSCCTSAGAWRWSAT